MAKLSLLEFMQQLLSSCDSSSLRGNVCHVVHVVAAFCLTRIAGPYALRILAPVEGFSLEPYVLGRKEGQTFFDGDGKF